MPVVKIDPPFRAIDAGLGKLANEERLNRSIAIALASTGKAQVQQTFRDSKSPWGFPWAPLKNRRGQPLLDTGRLRNSINGRVDGDAAVIGTNLVYAWTHQFGMETDRNKVPARSFLPIISTGGGRPSERMGKMTLPGKWRGEIEAVVIDLIRQLTQRQQ